MSKIQANQAQLNFAMVSVEDLEKSIEFYSEIIGLKALTIFEYEAGTTNIWNVPKGTRIRQSLCQRENSDIGQVLLIDFSSLPRNYIKTNPNTGMIRGFWNINFYVKDIHRSLERLENMGYYAWSEPTEHQIGNMVGAPIEVIIDGPDGIAVNLVQLPESSEQESIQEICNFFKDNGTTEKGFTEIVTTSHCVNNTQAAKKFYSSVLGMNEIFSDELSSKESNRFLRRPDDGRTMITFMQGNHLYGKIALSEPKNYSVPNNINNACPPNIGYFGQGFLMNDTQKVISSKSLNPSQQSTMYLGKDYDLKATCLVCPGSEALIYLLEQ
jgi:catechol 2,3-dioxygenase-like lactoylglutathione lyase family enzyme